MMEFDKKCVFILPYFGQFNNYFPLFLKSCGANPNYDWIIFTDNDVVYDYPQNVKVINTTLSDIKKRADYKFGFEVCMNTPYKLCDYKPAYGYLFEEYLNEYEYWGHCDCDVLFGNLEKILTPLLNAGYDKLFAAGHLTIYKNNFENNRRFMKEYQGRLLYKEAYTSDNIFVIDEDCGGHDNVHSIFLEDGANVYEKDLSMNPSILSAKFIRDYYDSYKHDFIKEKYKKARYYWNKGDILRIEWNEKQLVTTEFLYIHLQMRKMRLKSDVLDSSIIEFLPDRFLATNIIPKNKKELKLKNINFPYLYWYDVYRKKIKRKLNRWKKYDSKWKINRT